MRGLGEGGVRLQTSLKLNEDVYSTAFVSLLRHEYIQLCEDEADEDPKESGEEKPEKLEMQETGR